MKQAFTLIELLVVVLIIGILSAIALPQYQKTVEKARIAEAVIILRAIATANQAYYLANGVYAQHNEIDKLALDIPGGTVTNSIFDNRISSKYFIYSPNRTDGTSNLAVANRTNDGQEGAIYLLAIKPDDPTRLHCDISVNTSGKATKAQREICATIEETGSL